jgi:hypothetical protein
LSPIAQQLTSVRAQAQAADFITTAVISSERFVHPRASRLLRGPFFLSSSTQFLSANIHPLYPDEPLPMTAAVLVEDMQYNILYTHSIVLRVRAHVEFTN